MNNELIIDFGKIVMKDIPQKSEKAIRIMSFNLRCCDDKEGSIQNRSQIGLEVIKQYGPDSFGIQEAHPGWIDILLENLGVSYAYVAQGRDPGFSETCAVFYLKDKYELIDSGTIWLSDTPTVPFTKYDYDGSE